MERKMSDESESKFIPLENHYAKTVSIKGVTAVSPNCLEWFRDIIFGECSGKRPLIEWQKEQGVVGVTEHPIWNFQLNNFGNLDCR